MTSPGIRPRRMPLLATAGALLAACLLGASPSATAQESPAPVTEAATVVPVQTTGPADKRFNLVLLGDGYTAAELPAFRADVDKHLNVLWSTEPFASYRPYINVWAVEVPSAESGVDCDPALDSPRRDTPLNMGFWGGCNASSVQRLLTVDSGPATALADLVPGSVSANRQIVALANSDTYGGAGGTYATASGGNALSSLITPHEIGHSLGKLQDEYDYYARGVAGGTYSEGEPSSAHHTLLTEEQMKQQRAKWWRWLGEKSESGGVIGRYEGGLYSTKGVWRPSKHSIMKTLGYAFDQVEREVMVQKISAKVNLVQGHTPNTAAIGDDRTVWVDTLHPAGGELDVAWRLDGRPLHSAGDARTLDLRRLQLPRGTHTLTATVTDPTPYVRDPAIRSSSALTRTVSWTVDTALTTRPEPVPAAFTGHTDTKVPVGSATVVHADTTHPADRTLAVRWTLDGRPVTNPGNDRDLDLGALRLRPGTHTLTARIGGTHSTLSWTVDAAPAQATYALSKPLRTVHRPGRPVEYVYDGPFTMKLTSRDAQDGYVVTQFRVDGDGWQTYYGWPTDADAPYRFTPSGTVIDDLVHGKLGRTRAVPWDDATPDYGTHTIEYRTVDSAGNVSAPQRFLTTLLAPAAPVGG
ncbi:M64 family metallo-endopeptidase [Streptomyces sp. NBC_01142]|uniref:M64 family metallopeptidase n=1 Tax=Streptomyces sp. NBC_01142 TaxID=2975865 RepID=UPI002251BD2A|nr:M64 family metallopeptidase [Streptomyces sp. NBC_01142]MCX4820585.1 M64 family metallo-endopeptidase [Streptomyces sp. NBC_01142]